MHVQVRLLGDFAVTVEGALVPPAAWKSRRSSQLVALLALAPNRRLATEQAMDLLWPDLSPEAARANLHKTATLARQAMGSKESVVLRGEEVSLWPSAELSVDLREFEHAAQRARASGQAEQCAEVARRFAGEVLPAERYEEWAAGPRERARSLHLDLLRAGRLWTELAEADPTDETAHRGLMEEQFRAGRLHAAIRQFQRLRTILARELGVLPSAPTLALYREIVGTATTGWVRPGLVGREVELVRARAVVRRAAEGRPAAILVTGPAGIGKTRLGEELIEQAAGEGWLVLRGAGREQMATVPYWALVEAVQAAMLDRPDVADGLGDHEQALLARLTGLGPEQQRATVHRHAGHRCGDRPRGPQPLRDRRRRHPVPQPGRRRRRAGSGLGAQRGQPVLRPRGGRRPQLRRGARRAGRIRRSRRPARAPGAPRPRRLPFRRRRRPPVHRGRVRRPRRDRK